MKKYSPAVQGYIVSTHKQLSQRDLLLQRQSFLAEKVFLEHVTFLPQHEAGGLPLDSQD